MLILDMIAAWASRAILAAAVASLATGILRVAVVAGLWGWPRSQHELIARLFGFGMAAACVVSLGHATAFAIGRGLERLARGPRSAALLSGLAGLAGQAFALGCLVALTGPAGQGDLDLPISRTEATLVFGAVLAMVCRVARAAPKEPLPTPRRAAFHGAIAGAATLGLLHALLGETPAGIASDDTIVGGAGGGALAGVADGLALGAALGLAAAWSFEPRRWARRAVAIVLAATLFLAWYRHDLGQAVEARIVELEPLIQRVLASPRMSDPLFARWLSDVRVREEKAIDAVRRMPWYLIRLQLRRRYEVLQSLDGGECILRALLGEKLTKKQQASPAGFLLRLVDGFRVPAALEWQEHFQREMLVVFRGGIPLFSANVVAPADHTLASVVRYADATWSLPLPSGRASTIYRRGTSRRTLAGGWLFDISAPTQQLRLAVIDRLLDGRALAPGDDLAAPSHLIDPGQSPTSERARADIAPGSASVATARGWLSSGLRPYYGDVHTHASSTLGGSCPAQVAAAASLSMFCHFHALTEHFSAFGNAPAAAWIAAHAPAASFLPGEEITIGTAHLTALGLTRWIPTPWQTFTAPPDAFLQRAAAQGAVPVLAHAHYPMNDWQRTTLPGWRARGIAAAELTSWMDDDVYERTPDPPPSLGGSDAHCGCFGGSARTLILAADPSPKSLLEAIRAGRCIALRLDHPLLSRGSPAMRAAVWLLLSEPGRLASELAATWQNAVVARRPLYRD